MDRGAWEGTVHRVAKIWTWLKQLEHEHDGIKAFLLACGKESTCNVGDVGLICGVGEIPWRRKCQPIPVFLSGKSHGQRSLAGYSPWDHKELNMTERLKHTFINWRVKVILKNYWWKLNWFKLYGLYTEKYKSKGRDTMYSVKWESIKTK